MVNGGHPADALIDASEQLEGRMSYRNLMKSIFNRGAGAIPQSMKLQGQVPNAAGGHYFPVNEDRKAHV